MKPEDLKQYARVYAAVDLDAAVENIKAMEAVLPEGTGIIAVVKADGYGCGALPIARAVNPYVKGFAAATAEEAVSLRDNGIQAPILVLGPVPEAWYGELVKRRIRLTVFELRQAEALSAAAKKAGQDAMIHLAVDTGMSRIGVRPNGEGAELAKAISLLPGIRIEGVFTHFARADEADKESFKAQLKAYHRFMGLLREKGLSIPLRHCSNSAGIVDGLESNQLELVRAGIALYGLYPSGQVRRDLAALRPVLELKSHISFIKEIGPGTPVSYGGTFVAERAMRVATIPVGYGDGYPRSLSGKGEVLIAGKRAPILGRICMDQFMADVTGIPEAQAGRSVTLLGRDGGEEITAEELAKVSGGFHYELLCCLGKRVPRVYIRGGKVVGAKDCFQETYREL